MKNKRRQNSPIKQSSNRGVVLFISLIMLLSLTIIGLSAMNNSFVELKSSSNVQEKDFAYQASQAGLDAVMCLGDQTRSGTTSNNPFDSKYTIVIEADSDPSIKFDLDSAYDVDPFNTVNLDTCSVSNGALSIGTTAGAPTSDDLGVVLRRISNSASLRAIKGNSYEKLECHNFIIDSRYDYPISGANSSVWAGVCRQVGTGK